MRIDYAAPPTVWRFMASDAFVRAIVGPIGSGKSSGCVMEIPKRAAQQSAHGGVRRTRFAVIRNTYRQLKDTTRKTFEQWIPEDLGYWSEQDFTFHVRRQLGDGTRIECDVLFRALDKPADVKKVLSLELTGAYINEMREIPKEILDGLQGRVGRFPSVAQGGCDWFGIWGDTNPWATSHWGYELFSVQRPEGFELFEQPDGLGPYAENVRNLPRDYYPRLCNGKDQEWVDEYVRAKYPNADKGSVYGNLLAALEARGGLLDFEHPRDGVFAVFDLGISDATAIWWFRIRHGLPDIIDWYEATGEPLSHYFAVLESRGYDYRGIYLPHDARARSLQSGESTVEVFARRFPGKVGIVPDMSVADGIVAGRALLERPIRVAKTKCAEGWRRLRSYKYEWDEDKKVYSRKPVHDWTSHTSDGWRYLACVVQHAGIVSQPDPKREAPRYVHGAALEDDFNPALGIA